jgi:hypothetical protein
VRFEQRLRDGIHSGAIVLAFRRWKRSQVVPGRRYRTGIDMVEVDSVDVVEPSSVDAAQAREAGYPSVTDVGYRLSPRGESYLNYLRAR